MNLIILVFKYKNTKIYINKINDFYFNELIILLIYNKLYREQKKNF